MPSNANSGGLGASDTSRKTGIRDFGEMPWGTHLCAFYETTDDLVDTAASFFEAGLESHELCLWAVSDLLAKTNAMDVLRLAVPDLDRHLAEGRIEALHGVEWYLSAGRPDIERITSSWFEKHEGALARGLDGTRVIGNALWASASDWREFCRSEQVLDQWLAGRGMIVLCAYPLEASRAVDVLDVARVHKVTLARREGDWEFLETPELKLAKQEIRRLGDAINILSKPFPGRELLTPRERVTLAQIVRGASSKEAARALGVSPRTIEFHRANLMRKLGVRNTADLMRRVLAE